MNLVTPRVERCDFRGLPAVRLVAADGSSVLVAEYGGQVISWTDADGVERLYLSEKSAFTQGEPIRGGIPVVFPQFAKRGPLPHHGFARTAGWHVAETKVDGASAAATLRLTDNPQTRALWPAEFATTIEVRLEPSSLVISLLIDNRDQAPFTFTAALHTYLAVEAIEEARLDGLCGLLYSDNAAQNRISRDMAETLHVDREIDRVYFDATSDLVLREGRRHLEISSENFPDVVVWNPWREKCAALADMPADGFARMLCVEAAVIAQPVALAAGANWRGVQRLSVMLPARID